MKTIALVQTFFRSFFLQSLWNFERMQNVGFAFSMEPLLKLAHKGRDAFQRSLRRHFEYFNVHPYFAPIVMGVIYQREKALDESKRTDDPTLVVLKNSMGGAFGAIGDHVIWGTWRPFCAIMALSVGLLVGYPSSPTDSGLPIYNNASAMQCAKWWVVGFLSMFNSIHIWLRWRGLSKAADEGPLVVRWVESLHLQKWAEQIRRIGLLFLFVMVLIYLSRWTASEMLIWMVAVLLGSAILKRWGLSTFLLFYLVCGVSVAMTLFGDSLAMTQKNFIVQNRLGLHARPAAMFVQTTNKFKSSVKVRKGEQEVDGKSIMGLMMLAAEEGSDLVITADGPDERDVLAMLEKLFSSRFGEKD